MNPIQGIRSAIKFTNLKDKPLMVNLDEMQKKQVETFSVRLSRASSIHRGSKYQQIHWSYSFGLQKKNYRVSNINRNVGRIQLDYKRTIIWSPRHHKLRFKSCDACGFPWI